MRSAQIKLALSIVAAAAGACLTGVAAAQTPGQDSATGTFTLAGFSAPFTLDAHSGPSGENPGGTFVPPGTGVFSVACLQVSGGTAVIGVNGPGVQGPVSALIQVVDGPVDTLAASSQPGPLGADSCGAPPVATASPITSGNIVVVDAQPFPSSKDECKMGGWRNYGDTFRNQGQCAAFVERGPKP